MLTDNGTHFTDPKGNGWTAAEVKQLLAEEALFRCHSFALACAQNDIDHRLTKPQLEHEIRANTACILAR